jgi:threonine dehydrogenase-like Zn-dependent dehydrogenase
VRNGGKLCLFGHHFAVEPEAVNDWHLRGIAVLNTVPWGSNDLARDFRQAVQMLNAGDFDLRPFVSHQAALSEAASLMDLASAHVPGYVKGVVNF